MSANTELERWFERRFAFATPIALHPNLRARLAGAPARVAELTADLPRYVLTRRDGDAWSIQENAGHLLELESLWAARLEDFLAGEERLSPADLENTASHEARFNARAIEDLVAGFRAARSVTVARLDALSVDDYARVALHPRLNQPMRLFDAFEFVAEHDDHHLARIRELRGRPAPGGA